MKIKNYLFGVLGLAAVVACEPAFVPALEVTPLEIAVPAEGGEFTFTVKSNEDWTATTEADWFTLDLTSGKADQGSTPVKLSVNTVNFTEDMEATITIKSTSLSQTVNVTWSAKIQDGSEANPYYIFTAEELCLMRNKAESGKTTYFVLGADIDMDGIDSYVPVNYGDEVVNGETKTTTYDRQIHFDGANHTIRNFSCDWANYPSLFGVLYGSCKNLTITNAKITGASACGILAGYAGTQNGDVVMPAIVENVHVNGIINATKDRVGGMAGSAYNATFINCSSDVTITSTSTDIGGFAGKAVGTNVFTGCTAKAILTSQVASKNRVGGFIGWNSTVKTTITDCHVLQGTKLIDASGRTSASNGNFGGFIGFGDTTGTEMTITKSSATCDIEGSLYGTYNGGFIGGFGYASTVTITESWSAGNVVGHNYTGGFVGAVQNTLVLKKCWSSANVTSEKGKHTGGLVGTNTTSPIVIEDCYTTGTVYGYDQLVGGIIGRTAKAMTMKNCYATGTVKGTVSGVAGLAGKIEATSTVENCIAWNSKVECGRTSNTVWAPGAVTGTATVESTLKNCYRKSDFQLVDVAMTVVDHENIENGFAPFPAYAPSDINQRAYHGKAAAAGKTASAVAKDLGWDTAVWDLSGDLPKLK